MRILHTSLHQIDHHTDVIIPIDIANQSQDLTSYTQRLISEITSSTNRRQFGFKSNTTEVRTAISKFLDAKYSDAAQINSNRLLRVEKDAQEKIDHLDKVIQKGSLFQAVLSDGNEKIIVITKADHNQFLDEIDFTLKNGLPWEKRIFKAFLARFNAENPTEIFVYDTTNRMARYWWDNYLELEEKYTDTHNTKTSLEIFDRKVFNPMKKKHPADRTILRNATIGFFRNQQEFELDRYLENVLNNYEPVDPEFPKTKTIEKIKDLPEKYHFDRRFSIIREEIVKRQSDKILLNDQLELVLKEPINDLGNLIQAEKDDEGNKYIRIRTETGYERFKRRMQQ